MKIYLYDPTSLEFLKESEALVDPLESKEQGKEVFLMPRYSSKTKPKLDYKYGFALVYDATKDDWKQVEDHRGKTLWNKKTGEKTLIKDLYINIDDYTDMEPEKPPTPLSNEAILTQIEALKKMVEMNLLSSQGLDSSTQSDEAMEEDEEATADEEAVDEDESGVKLSEGVSRGQS